MEDDLLSIEEEIKKLESKKIKTEHEQVDMNELEEVVKYFLEHLENLLITRPNPIQKAAFFGLIFSEGTNLSRNSVWNTQISPIYQAKR
jgi:hypothetical protein